MGEEGRKEMKISEREIKLAGFPECGCDVSDNPAWITRASEGANKINPLWRSVEYRKLCHVEYPTHFAYVYNEKWGEG